jgi:hypothetical protein
MNNNSETAEFEFDVNQNDLLEDLSGKMRFVGLLLLVVGALNGVAGVIILFSKMQDGLSSIVAGVIFVLIGFWTRQASTSFTQIVETEGHDISNLMIALGELRKLYALQYWMILAGTALLVLDFIVGIVLGR